MRKLKITSLILAVIMVVSMIPFGMVSIFAAGPSSEPYTIGTADEFMTFYNNFSGTAGYYTGKTVTLTADIDLTGKSFPTTAPANAFTGILDGDGHTISGYTIVPTVHDYGWFGSSLAAGTTAEFKNVNFAGTIGLYKPTPAEANGTNMWRWGHLYASVAGTVTLTNVELSGKTVSKCTGGFFWTVSGTGNATFNNCVMSGYAINTWSGASLGGFVGANSGTVTINDSIVSGTVANMMYKQGDGLKNVGGFVGDNGGTLTIDDSVMAGYVVSYNDFNKVPSAENLKTTTAYMGGFLAYSSNGSVTITDSLMTGYVDAHRYGYKMYTHTDSTKYYNRYYAGGLIGATAKGTVTLTNIGMYGTVDGYDDAAGAISASLHGTTSVNYVIHAGRVWEGSGRSGRFVYSGATSNTSCYNIQFGAHTYGATPSLAGGSSYTIKKGDSFIKAPYSLDEANYAALHAGNFDATINGLTTYDSTQADAFATEKATALTNYKANWTFYEAGLPVPNGCKAIVEGMAADLATIDSAHEMSLFGTMLAGGYAFVGETVKLATDVTYNAGWDAFAATVTKPDTVWPISVGDRKFAGTFDGQGHTISGIYLNAYLEGVGIFGNVATGTTGTVKNLKVVNSYVQGSHEGVGAIFGEVDNETTTAPITDPNYVIQTKAIVDNVYVDANVVSNGSGNTNLGAGGIIGGSRADVVITNTAFVGKVTSKCRGVAAFVGAVRPYQANSINHYLHTITVENSYANAELIGLNSNKQTFVGGIVGYSNANTTTHNISNVILNNTITGVQYDGYIYGGAWCGASTARDGVTNDYQYWNIDNVKYVATTGTATKAVGTAPGGSLYNGVAFNTANYPATAEADLPKILYTFGAEMSVTLTDSLALNVYVDKDDVVLNAANTGSAQAEFNGEAVTAEETTEAYKFTFTGILPQQMGDEINATVGTYGKTLTIKDYLVALLADEAAQDVAADLLRYGAAAQTFSGYTANGLVTDDLDLDGLGTTVVVENIVYNAPVKGTKTSQIALRLENTLALVGNDGSVVAVFAADMNDDKTVGDATCSVAAYVAWALGETSPLDEFEQALIEAIYAYGLSAAAYN